MCTQNKLGGEGSKVHTQNSVSVNFDMTLLL